MAYYCQFIITGLEYLNFIGEYIDDKIADNLLLMLLIEVFSASENSGVSHI